MDRKAYMSHARQKLIHEYEQMINKMPETEILELMRSCPSCSNTVTSFSDIDRAIVEGSSLTEVDKLVGADNHCEEPHQCQASDDEPSDDEIDGTFRDAVDMVTDRDTPAVIVSYIYFEGPDDTSPARSRTYIFGDRTCIGMMIDGIIEKVESSDDDEGGKIIYLEGSDS